MYLFSFFLLLHGSNSLPLYDIEQNIAQPVNKETQGNNKQANLLKKVKSRQDNIGQAKNFMTDLKSNPNQFIAQVIGFGSDEVRNVITLLESLRASNDATKHRLIGKLERKTNEFNNTLNNLSDAEDAVRNAQQLLDNTEQDIISANMGLSEKEKDRANAELIYESNVMEENIAQEEHADLIQELNEEQQTLNYAINLLDDSTEVPIEEPTDNPTEAQQTEIPTEESTDTPTEAICATLFDLPNYAGSSMQITTGDTPFSIVYEKGFNDKTSSLKVKSGCSVIAFKHAHFIEPIGSFTSDIPGTTNANWNNHFSSFRCECTTEVICATLFDHPNYDGSSMHLTTGDTPFSVVAENGFNDKTSSLKVKSGCSVIAFKHAHFIEPIGSFTSDIPGTTNANWNNHFSSFRCECTTEPICATLFDHPNYDGSSMHLTTGDTPFSVVAENGFNDKTSSLKVKSGCSVIAFKHAHFIEPIGSFTSDIPGTTSAHWNNHFSSFRCECPTNSTEVPTEAPTEEGRRTIYEKNMGGNLDDETLFNRYWYKDAIICRTCPGCTYSHKTICYKRLTEPAGDAVNGYILFTTNWFSNGNVLNTDFELYSTIVDAENGQNKWGFCNYNDPGIGFPRDCGPTHGVYYQWNSVSRGGQAVTYWTDAAEALTTTSTDSPTEAQLTPTTSEVYNAYIGYHEGSPGYHELAITRGHLAYTFSVFPKHYSVSFDLKPTNFLSGWHSVIHFTLGANLDQYGDRTPAVWLHSNGNGQLHIASAVNGNANHFFNTQPIIRNTWTHIEIRQIQTNNNNFLYEIVINGQVVYSVINQNPKEFQNVKMYTSDPWSLSQPGKIKNLEITFAN